MTNPTALSTVSEDFTPSAMMAAAVQETGLSNFGPAEFLEPFEKLVEFTVEDIPLSPLGVMAFKADMHRFLVNRLRFEEDLRRHPEILDEDVSDPIIILGLVRTGTTKLQRMLAADPQAQKLYFWKILNPAPFPDTNPKAPDPRIETAREAATMFAQISPEFMAAHAILADEVEEDLLLQYFAFESIVHYFATPSRRFYDWVKNRPLQHTYRYEQRLIQYLQWQDGGKRGRHWVLKSPLHLGNLDALLEVFPKAKLVHCHRDIGEVTASFSSLLEAAWRIKTDAIDLNEVGRMVVEVWATEMDKYLTLRKSMEPKVDILDVAYEQIKKDPMTVIETLYRRSGLPFNDISKQAMLEWSEKNPKDRFGKNQYTLARYGLTAEKVNAAFKGYLERFDQYAAGISKGAPHAD